ncbi:Reduced folate carrier [Aphelenchoides besseyi]|nr:Reduced folate carrier [Aphelenchoides besseyi]KAI6199227.1 Reduced folate carrier [Aphelenchoides besseyi]
MNWRTVAAILCTYGALKEFRPTEPYLYQWQHDGLNLTARELSIDVYPISTYANLIFLIPTLLLTDILLYKSVLLLESLSYIGVWLTLIFGRSVLSQQVGQALYGLAMSMEVAYFAYSYVKVKPEQYTKVTVWTRSALEFGRCVSYVLSEPIVLLYPGKYQILNYISVISLTLTLIFALLLPNVTWREIAHRHFEDSNLLQNTNELPDSYLQFVVCRVRRLYADVRRLTADAYIVKWSASWALVSCGYLQASNYIQTLWGTAEEASKTYNGFVQGLIPVVCIVAVLPLQNSQFNWLFHDLVVAIVQILCAGALFLICHINNIWIMYAGYSAFRVLYQLAITITQCMIIKGIDVDASGFVFGLNTFLALVLQTGLSIFVTKVSYFNEIHRQFVVYSVYHLLIAIVFFVFGLWRGPWSDKKALEITPDHSTSKLEEHSSFNSVEKL